MTPYFLYSFGFKLFSPGKSLVFNELYIISVRDPISLLILSGNGNDLLRRTTKSNLSITEPFPVLRIDWAGPTKAIHLSETNSANNLS